MLEALLPELLDRVLIHLELPDFYSLRLTSRHLERESTQAFSAAAFSQLRVDFSAENLQWVCNIASHDEFRLAVHGLWCGDWDGKITGSKHWWEASYGTNGHWPRLNDGRVNRGCELVQQFVDSVSRFANCTSITVTDERPAVQNPSYKGPEQNLSSADAIDLVIHALSAPGAPLLQCFQTRIARGLDWDISGYITRAAVFRAGKRLAQLEELTLELDAGDGESAANLLHLIAAAPHVRTLRLRLRNSWLHKNGPTTESLLTQYLDSIPQFTPALDTLLIWSKTISEASLLRLLSNSLDTLKRLDLSVGICGGSWTAVLKHLQTAPFQRLQRFSMFACSDGPGEEFIAFCPLWKNREALNESLGVSFQFRIGGTSKTPPRSFHITGAMFESTGENAASRTKIALQAMMEYSHRCPRGHDANMRCAKLSEMTRASEGINGDNDALSRLWTGLPYALHST